MDAFLDILWRYILIAVQYGKSLLDIACTPLNALGPAFAISVIALITVGITKFLSKNFKTRRYRRLQQQFTHWYKIRQEAKKCEDPEKAKRLTRNIDEARLNRLYYDYFFEGLLISLVTKYLPVFTMLAYVNDAYRSANLVKRFGRDAIFSFGGTNGTVPPVGAVFWFVLSLAFFYIAWHIGNKIYTRHRMPAEQSSQ
ncbi:MAG: hypothetical protein B6I22_14130 [Desulfobacteraceae bacterium 4572_123]|nr:MAG: hypothetical protein B6I22_14130 [Desulfobacteraceae bacterium 4572_123]